MMGTIIKCMLCGAHGRDCNSYNVPVTAEELIEKHLKRYHKKEWADLNRKKKVHLAKITAAKQVLKKLDEQLFQTVFNDIDLETTFGDAFYRKLGLDPKKKVYYDGSFF